MARGCAHRRARARAIDVLKRTQWGYAANPNLGGVVIVGLGCEVFQIGRWKELYGIEESDTFRTMTIQDTGGTRKAIERASRPSGHAADGHRGKARDGARFGAHAGAAMRRLRRLFGHHGQSGARAGRRPPRAQRRHGDPLRDAGNLRRGTSADTPRRQPRGRREARRADPLVGGLHARATTAR